MPTKPTVSILYIDHALTVDNENRRCSGHFDAELSERGVDGAKAFGRQFANDHFDAIFCSDLQRSYKTAELAFGERFPIIKDARLRECDYGDFTHCERSVMDREQFNFITEPFPNGESYERAIGRIGEFLKDLFRDYAGKRVLIIGHGATNRGLEHWINGLSIREAIKKSHTRDSALEYELKAIT